MIIAVVDGQGGGIGKALVEKLKTQNNGSHEIIALGTNSQATSIMLRAGANRGATGENAIIYNAPRADIIVGVVGIVAANSMMGELTPAMSNAIASSNAIKILIPIEKCNLQVVGTKQNLSIQDLVDEAIQKIF